MAHLTLQTGAAIIVPIAGTGSQRRRIASRRRALREVAADQRPAAAWPIAHPRAPPAHGFKLRRMPQSRHVRGVVVVRPALIASALAAPPSSIQPVPTTVATPGMPNPDEALRQSMQHVDAALAELGSNPRRQ